MMLMMTRMILAIDDTYANDDDDDDDEDDDEVCSANTPAATPYSKWDSALKTNKRTDFLNWDFFNHTLHNHILRPFKIHGIKYQLRWR